MKPTDGMDRGQFHDKAWALWQAKALDDVKLPKLSIYAIRTLWDVLFDSMPAESKQTAEPVAWVVEENEIPTKDTYPRTLDWYAGEIAHLPIGTKLYAGMPPVEQTRALTEAHAGMKLPITLGACIQCRVIHQYSDLSWGLCAECKTAARPASGETE